MDSSTPSIWTGPFPIEGVSSKNLLLPSFVEIPIFIANCVDHDQTSYSAASDLVLHCLSMSLYGTLSINGLIYPINNYAYMYTVK